MGLKPDHWIRKMAVEHKMIEPFIENQVRDQVISYGVSSYGYDIRVADEFKIFTNVFGATVDPKHFDPKSMVDFVGQVCVIPPNSFALARTVEYFRIPRKVLTICIGKSTYARCFRGDTRVATIDGSAPTLEDMARRAGNGEIFWGYSMEADGRVKESKLEDPRYIGRDRLIELTIDDDEKIHCTPDHLFMVGDGRWVAAADLGPGVTLMTMDRSIQRAPGRPSGGLNAQRNLGQRRMDHPNVRTALHPAANLTRGARGFPASNLERLIPANDIRSGSSGLHQSGFEPVEVVTATADTTQDLQALRSRPTPRRDSRPHVVVSTRALAGDHDVYCLTVPGAGNFALDSGILVHNCGIIVNVTPFEPEWEGFVTLEISNTTPLPAKIYANEGMAQVLFFEADEECETSYADKKGKYQKQQSIVLPKL